jgi:hypothetical protein
MKKKRMKTQTNLRRRTIARRRRPSRETETISIRRKQLNTMMTSVFLERFLTVKRPDRLRRSTTI